MREDDRAADPRSGVAGRARKTAAWVVAGMLAAVIGTLLILSHGELGALLVPTTAAPVDQDVVMDQRLLTAHTTAAPGRPAIDRDRAVALATPYVTNAAKADSVTARYVELTLIAPDGGIAWGVHERSVWLVTFHGVTYVPVTTSASTCACGSYYQRPSTAVALDARSGGLVVSFGLN